LVRKDSTVDFRLRRRMSRMISDEHAKDIRPWENDFSYGRIPETRWVQPKHALNWDHDHSLHVLVARTPQ